MITTTPSRSRIASIVAAVSLLLGSMAVAAAAPSARKPTTHTVVIDATKFQTELLTVKAGDAIVWVNKDPFAHTVTSQSGGFDSHVIETGKSWRYTATKKGEFPYSCTFHPTMKATLRVR